MAWSVHGRGAPKRRQVGGTFVWVRVHTQQCSGRENQLDFPPGAQIREVSEVLGEVVIPLASSREVLPVGVLSREHLGRQPRATLPARPSLKCFPLVKVLGLPRSLSFSGAPTNAELFLQSRLLSGGVQTPPDA